MKCLSLVLTTIMINILLMSPKVSAHATVSPQQAEAGVFHTFHLNVPNEKNVPVTEMRLAIPSELMVVTPNAKAGWNIDVTKTDTAVTEIRWYGGEIAAGLRDEFMFRAQAPAEPTTLIWKAYQTYANGEVSAWDQKPNEVSGSQDGGASGPFSETAVITEAATEKASDASGAYILAGMALLLSLIALLKRR